MKFIYEYRTKDNVKHSGEIIARNRDDVFRKLKERSIRPERVMEAPGFFNKLFGKCKRWLLIGVLFLCLLVSFFMWHKSIDKMSKVGGAESAAFSTPRHQVYGDPAILNKMIRSEYKTVFSDVGCCMLAMFAQPGKCVVFADRDWRRTMVASLSKTIHSEITFSPDDEREVLEIKQIVAGMIEELKWYLSDGVGSIETFVRRLEERQREEIRILNRLKHLLENSKNESEIERRNDELRALGLPTIVVEEDENRGLQ